MVLSDNEALEVAQEKYATSSPSAGTIRRSITYLWWCGRFGLAVIRRGVKARAVSSGA